MVFALSGALMARRYKLDPFGVVVLASVTAIVMGTITGVAGGMIRDVLCNVIPMILRQEIYATAAMLGGALFSLFHYLGWKDNLSLICAVLGALSLQLAAIYWQVSLPAFQIEDSEQSNYSKRNN